MREPTMRVVWTDPVTGRRGYVVLDRLIDGLAAGGTRVRAGLTLEEVERLALTMSHKCGVMGLRAGGGKAGIDCDPHDPEMPAMLRRFIEAMRPLLTTCFATAEDLGVTQRRLDELFAELGMVASVNAAVLKTDDPAATFRRMAEALSVQVEGVGLGDLVGGYGVAAAAAAAAEQLGMDPPSLRAVVQGFGTMGGGAARYLARRGVRIVGVVDAQGAIADDEGLDVEALLRARDELGEIDRATLDGTVRLRPREEWLEIPCDVLVPAAVGDAINAENCDRVRARIVAEAANFPTTEAAAERLHERGVVVLPDFVANSGTNNWFWWVLRGEVGPDPEAGFAMLDERLGGAVRAVLRTAAQRGVSPRAAAKLEAEANLAAMA